MKVILHGYYSEYSLDPLEKLLKKTGYEVFLLNHSPESISLTHLEEIISDRCLVITSCHFLSDKNLFKRIYPALPNNIITPIEIFRRKSKKCKMAYIPHDLIEPIKWLEWPMTYIFDMILLPYPSLVPPNAVERCKVTGWVKELSMDSEIKHSAVFLPSNIVVALANNGKEAFYNRYRSILSAGIPIKLPVWPGLNELEEYLSQQGASLIPATVDSFTLIRASRSIVTNSLSSVAREAALLSKDVYFSLDQWTSEKDLIDFISTTPNCYITRPSFNWAALNTSSNNEEPHVESSISHSFLTVVQELLTSE